MKTFKVLHHSLEEETLQINQKDYPSLNIGDVIEIYALEDNFSRLLLQVTSFSDDSTRPANPDQTKKPSIVISQKIGNTFRLPTFSDAIVNKVDKNDVALDSVELNFKNQYLARSDMWRLKKQIVDTCVYLDKKIVFNSNIQCDVFEMWLQGERVASGYVNEDTKVVYRSSSSMVYLFIQMSSEMWEYDINGDLYFEKAINGFISDLFEKWKKFKCYHDVTIVLFSRTFYEANSIDEFPEEMKECLQNDYKGRFYEDFYRVAVQNERYEDWSQTLILLRRLFNQYNNEVLKYHEINLKGKRVPKGFNSTASQGNFLEVLNMSLNVFEKHHLDRSFDRTGQLSVVISPGVGVFEVDLDLTNITKQRIIDNGIGSDLVCLGEQPLHAVPLFKFNAKSNLPTNIEDVQYNMPHWINLSFYSSVKQINYSSFIPRIKFPNVLPTKEHTKTRHKSSRQSQLYRSPSRESPKACVKLPTFVDYDEYDAQIFKVASTSTIANSNTLQATFRRQTLTQAETAKQSTRRKLSDNFAQARSDSMPIPPDLLNTMQYNSSNLSASVENKMMREPKHLLASTTKHVKPASQDDLIVRGYSVPHTTSPLRPKALINPFDPSHVTIKLTSNRRRWTHVFPQGATGIFMQQHHYQAVPQNTACTLLPSAACVDKSFTSISRCDDARDQIDSHRKISFAQIKSPDHPWAKSERLSKSGINHYSISGDSRKKSAISRNTSVVESGLLWAWGMGQGEQEWTPAITTGVDWKSLTLPACLPISTDFLPDKRTLQQDYVTFSYNLLPEDLGLDLLQRRCYRGEEDAKSHTPLKTFQAYLELICQRLQQGFQIILSPKISNVKATAIGATKSRFETNENREIVMSIGRIFHELKVEGSNIIITNYHPRHPYPEIKIHYCYRFKAPDNEIYGVSWADFLSEKLESYNWNYLDNYICMRGDSEYELRESFKPWRFRILMLPCCNDITKEIIDKYTKGISDYPCDLYHHFTEKEKIQLKEGFINFLLIFNGIRRNNQSKKNIFKNETAINSNRRRSLEPLASLKQTSIPDQLEIKGKERSATMIGQDRMKVRAALGKPQTIIEKVDEIDGCMISTMKGNDPNVMSQTTQPESTEDERRLTIKSAYPSILDAMKESLNFFMRGGLPHYTFISAEGVNWAMENVEGIENEAHAVSLFQAFCNADLICHTSCDKSQPFRHGVYLYFIIDQNSEIYFQQPPDISMFQKEWMEVGFDTQVDCELPKKDEYKDFAFKKMTFVTEDGSKFPPNNRRVEWIDVRFHSIYDPEQAFELIIEWMVSTGNSIPEIVQGWLRKANQKACQTGLHLVPIPSDPFALPFSSKSDPLRGPIYIPLNVESLSIIANKFLNDGEGLFNFQERILVKFGFIPFLDPKTDNQRQFVHVSGSIFVMIPSKNPFHSLGKKFRKRGKALKQLDDSESCSPHEEYITRHFSGVKLAGESARIDAKVGFLWCWNYMITRRWKTNVTGDENSMRKIMEDFHAFCSNTTFRLSQFWDDFFKTEDIFAQQNFANLL